MEIQNKDDMNQIIIDGEEKEIVSVSYKSVMKVTSYFLFPVFLVLVYLFILGAPEGEFNSVNEAIISIVLLLFVVLVGYIITAIVMAFSYNMLSKKFGGLVIRIKDKY